MIIPIADELERIAKGEILSDDWNKVIYSVDSSQLIKYCGALEEIPKTGTGRTVTLSML